MFCKSLSLSGRKNGSNYPPKTLYQLLCGLLRHSRNVQEILPIFLIDRIWDSRSCTELCDCYCIFRKLYESVVGTAKKSTAVITEENEDPLWASGTLNVTYPQGLQKAAFFYVGKVCCLRGGEEQRTLKISQFQQLNDPECYVYTEHGSKNRNGGFFQLHVDNKEVSESKCWSALSSLPPWLVPQ